MRLHAHRWRSSMYCSQVGLVEPEKDGVADGSLCAAFYMPLTSGGS